MMGKSGGEIAAGNTGVDASLRRVLTFPWLLLYGLGSTVGAGIYILTGVVAGRAGIWAPFAFLLASLLAGFTAMSFAEFSARFPRAGGALIFVREGFGRQWISVLVGLGTATAGVISAATVSRGFVAYAAELAALPEGVVLAGVILLVGAIAAWGVKESIVVAGVVTLIEVGGLIAVLIFGGVHLAAGPAIDVSALGSGEGFGANMTLVVTSAVLCFYAFLGFEDIVNVAEEVRDVRTVMPRAIIWTLVISTALYIAVSVVSVLVVSPAELGQSEAPLALVFDRAGGSMPVISLIALVAMLNGALVQVIMASRVVFSLSRDGILPDWMGKVHPRTQTPLSATAIITLGVGLFAFALPITRLAEATASVALAVFVLVNLALLALLLRESREGGAEVEVTPKALALPAIGALASFCFLGLELVRHFGGGN